jgi:phosphatidylglycerol:prolipoprotein diacylglycerol transferase
MNPLAFEITQEHALWIGIVLAVIVLISGCVTSAMQHRRQPDKGLWSQILVYVVFAAILAAAGFLASSYLTWEPLQIRWYGISMALSMLLGAWIAATFLRRQGRNGDLVWDGLLWIIIAGVIGARLVYVVTNFKLFFGPNANPWEMFALWHGGLSFHGGIIAGLLVAYLYFMNKEVAFIEVMDAFAPGVALGVLLVRFGNFMNGDILGYKWNGPWAMNFPNDEYHMYGQLTEEILRHPTELYGMLVGLFCLVVSIILLNESWGTKRFPVGTAYLGFVLTYSVARSLIEDPFRNVPYIWQVVADPEAAGFGFVTYSQAASVVLILLALWGFTQLRKWEKLRAEAAARMAKRADRGPSRQVRRAMEREKRK